MRICDLRNHVPDNANLYLPSDGHEGNAACYEKGIAKEVEIIRADKKGLYANLGDAIECITVNDKRYDPSVHGGRYNTLLAQANRVAEMEAPVADKCLLRLLGNHEFKAHVAGVGRFDEHIAGKLAGNDKKKWNELPMTPGYSCICVLSHMRIFLAHGWKVGKFSTSDPTMMRMHKQLKIKKLLRNKAGNCELMAQGHGHEMIVLPPQSGLSLLEKDGKVRQHYPTMVTDHDGYIAENSRWYAMTGSCLKTMDDEVITYGEVGGYDPSELGMLMVAIRKGHVDHIEEIRV